MTESDWDDWNQYWGGCPPQGPLLRESHQDRWLRIHSLPGGKRYATSAAEWDELRLRHDTVASAVLEVGAPCLFVEWSWEDRHHLDDGWRRVPRRPDWSHDIVPEWFFITSGAWRPGAHDRIIEDVAEDRYRVVVMSHATGSLYCPYDGGADLFFTSLVQRRALAERFADWRPGTRPGL